MTRPSGFAAKVRAFLFREVLERRLASAIAGARREIWRFDGRGQNPALAEQIRLARLHVPYYRELGGDSSAWPLLTKDIIRSRFDALQSDQPRRSGWYRNWTGGSTGEPLEVILDANHKLWNRATEDYYLEEFLGVAAQGDPKVVLWGSRHEIWGMRSKPSKRLRMWLTGNTMLNAYTMTPADLDAFAGEIRRRKPLLIKGYAGALFEMARHIRTHNLRVSAPRFVVSTAEMLQPEARLYLEETFGAPVRELYGSREMGAMAGECGHGRLHVFSFFVHAEVVGSDGRPAPAGQRGGLVVSQLRNRAMPLLRYEIRDMAARFDDPCPCGSTLPAITPVQGRYSDYFVTPGGTLVYGGYVRQVLFGRMWMHEYQVVQAEPSRLDIYYVASADPPAADMADIESKLARAFGGGMRFAWHPVDDLPRTPHGKRLHTRSLAHENPSRLFPPPRE